MKNAFLALLAALAVAVLAGCGGNVQKGIYKDKDKPAPAEKEGESSK